MQPASSMLATLQKPFGQPHLVVAPRDLKNLPPYYLFTMLNCHLLEQAIREKKNPKFLFPLILTLFSSRLTAALFLNHIQPTVKLNTHCKVSHCLNTLFRIYYQNLSKFNSVHSTSSYTFFICLFLIFFSSVFC